MRWSHLFADLEGEMAASHALRFEGEVAELTRAERAGVDLAARLTASRGASITVTLRDGARLTGVLADGAAQWLLLHQSPRQHLVPASAVSMVQGLAPRATSMTEVERRLSFGAALRVLARDRARAIVRVDGAEVVGLLGAVAADHVEVHRVGGDEAQVVVPFAGILEVSSARI